MLGLSLWPRKGNGFALRVDLGLRISNGFRIWGGCGVTQTPDE